MQVDANEKIPLLVKALADPDEWVRTTARDGLVPLGTKAVPPVFGLLWNAEPEVQRAAGEVLCRIGPKAVPALAAALEGMSEGMPHSGARLLGRIGSAAAAIAPVLLQAERSADAGIRRAADLLLGQMGVRGMTPAPHHERTEQQPSDFHAAETPSPPPTRLEALYPEVYDRLRKIRGTAGRDWQMLRGHLLAFRTWLQHGSCAAAAGERGKAGGGSSVRYHLDMLADKLCERLTARPRPGKPLELTGAGKALREWVELHADELGG
jgi:hypothetical protein